MALALSEIEEVRQNLDETLANMLRETGGEEGFFEPCQRSVFKRILALRNKAADTINDIGRLRSL